VVASWLRVALRTPKNSRIKISVREVAHARKQKPLPTWIKFCTVIGVPDEIICAIVGGDRLRSLRTAGSQILPFPLGFRRRLFKTLALPCEYVVRLRSSASYHRVYGVTLGRLVNPWTESAHHGLTQRPSLYRSGEIHSELLDSLSLRIQC